MSVKAAVVVGVVVVALFVAAVLVGGSRQRGGPAQTDGLVGRLGELVGDPAAVPRTAVSADCVDEADPDLLVFAGGCAVVVRHDAGLGLVDLVALTPLSVRAPAPEGDLVVDDDLAAGEDVRVAVGEGETRIDLRCGAGLGGLCRARLAAG